MSTIEKKVKVVAFDFEPFNEKYQIRPSYGTGAGLVEWFKIHKKAFSLWVECRDESEEVMRPIKDLIRQWVKDSGKVLIGFAEHGLFGDYDRAVIELQYHGCDYPVTEAFRVALLNRHRG